MIKLIISSIVAVLCCIGFDYALMQCGFISLETFQCLRVGAIGGVIASHVRDLLLLDLFCMGK